MVSWIEYAAALHVFQPGIPTVDDKQRKVGDMNRQNVLRIVNSFKPLLLSYGYFEETIDKYARLNRIFHEDKPIITFSRWTAKVHEELQGLKKPLYIRVSASTFGGLGHSHIPLSY